MEGRTKRDQRGVASLSILTYDESPLIAAEKDARLIVSDIRHEPRPRSRAMRRKAAEGRSSTTFPVKDLHHDRHRRLLSKLAPKFLTLELEQAITQFHIWAALNDGSSQQPCTTQSRINSRPLR